MPLEIICMSCGALLYNGYDLKSAKDVIRPSQNKCKNCGKSLSDHEYTIQITRSSMGN